MRPLALSLVLVLQAGATEAKITPAARFQQAAATPPATASPEPAVRALRSELDRLIDRTGSRRADWGALVVSLDRADTLYRRESGRALTPASNIKLFTTAAALHHLGPDYRYHTYLLTDGPVRAGVLEGDLIVYGTGDPTLSDRFHRSKTAVWESWAAALRERGVTEVRGDVVGDGSFFDGPATGRGWRERYMAAWYAAPAAALSFADNVVTLHVTPGEEPGWRPEIRRLPGGRGIAIVNQATTVAGGRSRLRIERASYDGPIVVRGQIRRGHPGFWRRIPVADPGRYAASVFAEVLQESGIRLRGDVRSIRRAAESHVTGRTAFASLRSLGPAPRVITVHRSPPLIDILSVINGESHNLYAEQVLRTVGRVVRGEGSVAGGTAVVRAFLEREVGLAAPALRMLDGSGLSTLNRATAGTIVGLLAYMADSPSGDAYARTLPVAGTSRGLRRMYRTAAAGNLRAKTGTLRSASALSGYVRTANGERLAFSILANEVPSTWRAKRVEDAIGARLARFRRPPAAVPAPVAEGARPEEVGDPAAARASGAAAAAPATGRVYAIRRGDTLEAIARRFETTVRALEAANPGIRPRRLLPGQEITIP